MNNQFSGSYEKINFDNLTSYLIGFNREDIKDIVIQFLKLQNKKIEKIKFCNNSKSIVAELVNNEQFILILDEQKITLSQNDLDVILSFLLDATDEYMSYDHIDLDFKTENRTIDVCFKRI